MTIRMTLSERVYQVGAHLIVVLVALICLVPFIYVVSISITPIRELNMRGGYVLIPSHITWAAYKLIIGQGTIPHALMITVARVLVGTLLHLIISSAAGYALSKTHLPGYRFFVLLVLIAFLFGPGLIPYYLLLRSLHMVNTFWVMVIPGAAGAWSILIFRQFFLALPPELEEAAIIDGASALGVLWRIILPLSLPVFAALGMFTAVGYWNDFLTNVIFVPKSSLHTIAFVLQQALTSMERFSSGAQQAGADADALGPEVWEAIPSQAMKMATVVVATVPILLVYPFLQKHFAAGMLGGAIKG